MVLSDDFYCARYRLQKPQDEFEQSGFAPSIWAYNADKLPGIDREGNIPQYRCVLVGKGNIFKMNNRMHGINSIIFFN